MKTFLQRLNDFTEEYINMPLTRFFILLTGGLFSLLLIVIIFAPFTLWKLASVINLYVFSMITAILAYVNYQLGFLPKQVDVRWNEDERSEESYQISEPTQTAPEAHTGFMA